MRYASLHFDVAAFPMQFISMDLVGEFHPQPQSRKYQYALTVICMLPGYVFCIPFEDQNSRGSYTGIHR